MLINYSTAIDATHGLLVPYEPKHVATYHEWMRDEVREAAAASYIAESLKEIQLATASEPLSLEEEHQMQRNWRSDTDKLTFIICRPLEDTTKTEITEEDDTSSKLIGDINLFLSISDEDDGIIVGELELMIAEQTERRRGIGRASLLAFMRYIDEHQTEIVKEFQQQHPNGNGELAFLRVRIGNENHSSLSLFESIGFEYVSEKPNVFREVELRTPTSLRAFSEIASARNFVPRYRELAYRRHEPSE